MLAKPLTLPVQMSSQGNSTGVKSNAHSHTIMLTTRDPAHLQQPRLRAHPPRQLQQLGHGKAPDLQRCLPVAICVQAADVLVHKMQVLQVEVQREFGCDRTGEEVHNTCPPFLQSSDL